MLSFKKRERVVIKRIRTEYMNKFKDPKWESYTKCYEDMLKYRLTRRLLEHTHSPWFWNDSDSGSESGGSSIPPNKTQVESKDRTEPEYEECEGVRTDRRQKQRRTRSKTTVTVPKISLPEEEDDVSPQICAANGAQTEGLAGELRVPEEEEEEEEEEEQRAGSRDNKQLTSPQREQDQERDPEALNAQQTKTSKSFKPPRRTTKVRPAPLWKPGEDNKESRHPFALYGWGERHAEMAGKKTHNVGPSSSTKEIHESALRAKTRREVERQIQAQKSERRRAKSADLDKNRTKLTQPEFNPWLTEYMRCFSARSR
ncbi:centriole, cilia and spindle-associated protein [Polymixia lowei]